MAEQSPSNGVMREAEIILVCVRWYLRYALSYRDLEELMRERGLSVDHTTIYRSRATLCFGAGEVLSVASKKDNQLLVSRGDYVIVKGEWMYLYRAVDSQGNTLEFLLSATRDAPLCEAFFRESASCFPHRDSARHHGR